MTALDNTGEAAHNYNWREWRDFVGAHRAEMKEIDGGMPRGSSPMALTDADIDRVVQAVIAEIAS